MRPSQWRGAITVVADAATADVIAGSFYDYLITWGSRSGCPSFFQSNRFGRLPGGQDSWLPGFSGLRAVRSSSLEVFCFRGHSVTSGFFIEPQTREVP